MNITNHKHSFKIQEQEIELTINCKNGYYTCAITKGNTGTGNCCGGKFDNLQEYIEEMEKQHKYSYNFFNHGLDYAQKNL